MKIPIKAKIYYAKDGATALKAYANVNIGDMVFVNSYAISNTMNNPNTLRAFPPSYKSKNSGYKPYIEFADSETNPLSAAIYKACKSAYCHYEDTGRLHEYGETIYLDLGEIESRELGRAVEGDSLVKSEKIMLEDDISILDVPF